ncbi:MAG: type II restriction endonuclease, partial [Candidatus Marinimicrobia bacterium]|nr:type II restriction endonuclease [Candidatus Neomarinimicrobiota bacterium]
MTEELEFTYFSLKDYEKPLRNNDPKDDTKLVALYKIFSPEHLLKLPFANDSNSLDKRFYSELLHIIGLKEIKQGSKKLIQRYPEEERNAASLIENAINKLNSRDTLIQVENLSSYGKTREEQLFGVGLELCITWINRILFLKLLEAQLLSYHKGDPAYKFLNIERIKNYDDLDSLFFDVLACKYEERTGEAKTDFSKIPYLNSSLFEPSDLERKTIYMTDLRDERNLSLLNTTVLKNEQGKKLKGEILALDYLFKFLDAYDFASEGSENIQEEKKSLINASVLGLIFEKINGYKDGSYFTPGFITEYMSRETIRRAVVRKFNEAKNWDCKDLTAVYNKGLDIEEANTIVNSLKICDPAVGSGHFLVSALNEILAIKHELKILCDRDGKRLFDYRVEVENDELVISHEHSGMLFEYNPTSPESQKLQKTLFHEKQTIIENCLFGVDINPNSVKICRLRLWIELLKNAYYKSDGQLETLPNIDINIKCGNSLISRYPLDADLK